MKWSLPKLLCMLFIRSLSRTLRAIQQDSLNRRPMFHRSMWNSTLRTPWSWQKYCGAVAIPPRRSECSGTRYSSDLGHPRHFLEKGQVYVLILHICLPLGQWAMRPRPYSASWSHILCRLHRDTSPSHCKQWYASQQDFSILKILLTHQLTCLSGLETVMYAWTR